MIGKTLFFGLLTLLALAVAAPALTGLYLARGFDDLVARFERPGISQVVSSHFQRGWFKSHAMVRLRLDGALCAQSPCPTVTLDSVVHHGPISFTAPREARGAFKPTLGVAVTGIDPASLWPRLVFEPTLEPLRLVTRVGLDGRAVSHLDADGASVDVARKERLAHVESSALDARLTVPLRDAGIDGEFDWPRFRIVGEAGGQLGWRGLVISSREASDSTGVVAGRQLRAESVRMASQTGNSALLQGLIWRLQPVSAGGDRDGVRLDGRISRLVLDNNEYGPLILQGRLDDIDVGAWAGAGRELAAANGLIADGDDSASPTPYQNILAQLLATRPRIDLERLLLTTPDGDIRGHLRISAPDEPLPDRLLADTIARFELDFALDLPATMTRDIAVQVMLNNGWKPYELEEADITQALTRLLDRGLIERASDGDAYRLRLRIHEGRLMLNGRNQPGWQSVVDRYEAAREQL